MASSIQRPLYVGLAALAAATGVAFLYVAGSVAFEGTGAQVPSGEGVVEGTLVEGTSVRVPAGPPIQFGDIVVTDPNASRAVDYHWSSPVGDSRVTIATADGERELELPPARDWKGPIEEAKQQVDSLDGIPFLEEHPEIGERQGPPYLILVRGLRAGDAIVASTDGDSVRELHVGDRATLEAYLAQREAMRWPMVGLMAIVGLTSLVLAFFFYRKARTRGAPPE